MRHHISISMRRVSAYAGILGLIALLSACEGVNQFGDTDPPEVTAFEPTATIVAEGATLSYDITATGQRNVTDIRVVFSGTFEKDTTFGLEEPGREVQATLSLTVPMNTANPELTAQAWAIDVVPDTTPDEDAPMASVTVTDATPPTIGASASPGAVGSGDPIDIRVTAQDARGVAALQVDVSNGLGYDSVLVDTPAAAVTEYDQTWELIAPDVQFGTLTFVPSAVDINDLTAEGDTSRVTLGDESGPQFLSLTTQPDSTIPLGDSIQVTVEVADPSGIQSVTFVGLAYRGDPQAGTDFVVQRFLQRTIEFPRPTQADTLPKLYTLHPYIRTEDFETTEPLELFVVAQDSVGNVSTLTKAMFVGGPDVKITYPPDGLQVGLTADFDVRMTFDDNSGIDSAKLVLGGVANQEFDLALPARTDTPFTVVQHVTLPGNEGIVTLRAYGWNPLEVRGQSLLVEVEALASQPSDVTPPVVSVTAQRLSPTDAAPRMELLDEIRVRVSAFDGNSGLARIGLKIIAVRGGVEQDTVTEDLTFGTPSNSLEELTFQVPVDSLYGLFGITNPAALDSIIPENVDLRIHGFAADAEDQVACSVGIDEQRECSPTGYSAAEFYEADDTVGLPLRIEPVRGITVLLDNTEAVIADLAVDTIDDRLFLSNESENLVEFLQLDPDPRNIAFEAPVQVGSQPLGLFMGERVVSASEPGFGLAVTPGDTLRTLLVANSGGTNVSLVHLEANAANVQEVDVIRLRTPNAVLFEIEEAQDEFGNISYTYEWIDLADRPQFLAQDSLLRTVYSTRRTDASDITTIRFIHADPDPTLATDEPEVRYIITASMVDPATETSMTLANVDSVAIKAIAGDGDSVKVFMHEPGYPGNVIANANWEAQFEDAIVDLIGQIDAIMTGRGIPNQASMFYPFFTRGTWDLDAVSWGDTTFLSASGNRGKIAVGEGATAPVGRIMLWNADEAASFSDAIQIEDLTLNAAERVLGVGLNHNGSLGVARGENVTFFFDDGLRLQGLYDQEDAGGSGAAFHPEHDELSDGGHTSTDGAGAAFTGTSNHSIDVVNTFHFNLINRLVIRDNIVGPLRLGPPLASDNGGLGGTCVAMAATLAEEKDCIVAKLYGITSAGGVVIVNVRRRDLEPYAPDPNP